MRYLFISCALLSSVLLISGCEKKSEHQGVDSTASAQASAKPNGVKDFPVTADDATDIAQLEAFNQKFNAMSQDMKTELEQLKQQGQLSPEFVAQRKRDRILSALNMLKDLELKTEQGHYIQGLLASYWEEKRQELEAQPNPSVASEPQANQINLVIQAEDQLDYWQDEIAKK